VLLLSAALLINYVDRGNLATAAPLIQDQMHLSATQLGLLLSAFYYSYVLAMVPAGWLAERLGAHRVLGVGVALWAVSTFLQILRERGLWGASLGHFASNYNYYFILAWLPLYLVKVRGFSMQSMAGVARFAYLINAAAGLFSGWATDAGIRSGRSASVIYKSTMALNHVASIAAMVGMALLPLQGSIVCLFAYQVVVGLSSPGVYAIPQIMAGPTAAGPWVGVQNTCGNVAGMLAPMITGMLVDATGSFTSAFALAALVNVLGLVGWMWILPRVALLRWDLVGAIHEVH
jgi:sugar phosphate permease